jgi:hypothetical protein
MVIRDADKFLIRVIQGLAAMRDSGSTFNVQCPLFPEPRLNNDAILLYDDCSAPTSYFSFSFDEERFAFQMSFYELLADHGRYFPDEPGEYGHLYSHPGQQRKKAYREACIRASFPFSNYIPNSNL